MLNKKKFLSTTLALSIGLGGAYSYVPLSTAAAEELAQVESAFNITADVTVQQNQIANFEEIKSYFAEETVDLEKVKTFYEENFKEAVQARAANIDEEITKVIDYGVDGKVLPGAVKQAVDKGLQGYFWKEITNFVKVEAATALEADNKVLAKENLDKAVTLFEGSVYVTAGKRDGNFGTLTQDFMETIAIPGLYDAVEAGDVTELQVNRQYFEKTMMKVFVLATLRYGAIVPEDHDAGDTDAEKIHAAEGYFFFLPIHGSLSSADKEAADAVLNAFGNGDGSAFTAEEIKTNLALAISGKVEGYFNKTLNQDLATGDVDKAKIHAAEGNTFVSQLEVIVEERLGEAAYTELLDLGGKYYDAVEENNVDLASEYATEMTKIINTLNLIPNFEKIKGFFSAESVDLAEVKAFYDEKFKEVVADRNSEIDANITAVLEQGVNGDAIPGQVKQAVDKGLQWFFYDEINYLVKQEAGAALAAGNKELAEENLDKAIALYEGSIKVTAGKRDKDFGTTTQANLDTFVTGLQQAVENGDVTDYGVFRQYFQKTMMKVFVLATSKYAAKVPADHAAGDTAAEKAHLAEGYFFFMPINKYLSGGSQEAADFVKDSFASGDGSQVDAEAIKTNLARAINTKVSEYAGKTLNNDLASGNLDKAKIHAAEGNAFLGQLEVIVKERLGEDKWAEIDAHATAYNKAVIANDTNEARKHAFAIVEELSAISGVNFEIGGKSLIVNGEVKAHGEAVSYLDTTTNRTLASARFVSDALGAKVDWNNAERKVIITHGDKTVEFTIGSKDVYVNGEKSDYTLDQAALIKDDRSYIPVRAAAELLDGKVFYYNGKVVINN